MLLTYDHALLDSYTEIDTETREAPLGGSASLHVHVSGSAGQRLPRHALHDGLHGDGRAATNAACHSAAEQPPPQAPPARQDAFTHAAAKVESAAAASAAI